MTESASVAWIAVDWGTSNLRAWAMSEQGHIIHTGSSSQGMGGLTPELFESALLSLISAWLPPHTTIPVIACGMVGAKQGWVEVAYQCVPTQPLATAQWLRVETRNPQIGVYIIGGLSQAVPADVMRGEETQIAGLLRECPGFNGVVCLPGTHSKWVRIASGQIVQKFQTYMTGELFALISKQSILRHSVAESGWNDEAFREAVIEVINEPEAWCSHLFSLRASALLDSSSTETARSRLSGWLIGSEIMAAQSYWKGQDVTIIGEGSLAQKYATALELIPNCNGTVSLADTQIMTLAGLTAAYANLMKTKR